MRGVVVFQFQEKLVFVLFLTLCLCPPFNLGEQEFVARDKATRPSVGIQNAIEFYNITMNLKDQITMGFKFDHYENVVHKDGVELKKEMDDIELRLVHFIHELEQVGGPPLKFDNITTTIDEFSETIVGEYDTMLKNMKEFTSKCLEAHSKIKSDKLRLMKETDGYSKLRTKYLEMSPILVGAGLRLQKPEPRAPAVTTFDISVLETLLKYFKEIDALEDEITPVIEKKKFAELTSDETAQIEIVAAKADILENHKIPTLIKENENMLRHYEIITNAAVERILQLVERLEKMFDEKKTEIINIVNDYSSQDTRILALHKKYLGLLQKANEKAEALMKGHKVDKVKDDSDEEDDDYDHDEL